jgi:hypothetical protein
MPFVCSICGEQSTRICARCTKDACDNHLCEKCLRCSDCCECEVTLAKPVHASARPVVRAAAAVEAELEPDPEPRLPEPDPDPVPMPEEPGPMAP